MKDETINVKIKKSPEDKFRLLSENLVRHSVSKDFEIELENGETIIVNKWSYSSDCEGDDSDWEITEGKEIYDKMSEEEQDLFYDFVMDLSLID